MCRSQTDIFSFLARVSLILPIFRFRTFCLFSSFYPHIFGLNGRFSAFQYRNFAHSFSKIQNV